MQGIAIAAATPYILWVAFLAVMNLQRAHDAGQLQGISYAMGLPLLVFAYCLDVAVNVAASVVFLEGPREWTLSERLSRHIRFSYGWRHQISMFVMRALLEPFDTSGGHRSK